MKPNKSSLRMYDNPPKLSNLSWIDAVQVCRKLLWLYDIWNGDLDLPWINRDELIKHEKTRLIHSKRLGLLEQEVKLEFTKESYREW